MCIQIFNYCQRNMKNVEYELQDYRTLVENRDAHDSFFKICKFTCFNNFNNLNVSLLSILVMFNCLYILHLYI
jgi:hypothetical protein